MLKTDTINQNSTYFILKKFKTRLLKEGKQTKSNSILNNICNHFKKQKQNPFLIIEEAVTNIKPFFIIKTVKKGKQNTIIPLPIINENKRISLAIKWIIKNAKRNQGNTLTEQLVKEITDAALNKGFSKQEQQEIHSLVLANRKQIQTTQKQNSINFK